MANTNLSIKWSNTPSAAPTLLANGELAINMSDKRLYFKNDANTIDYIRKTFAFETVNIAGTTLVATSETDVLSLNTGPGILISGAAGTDTVTISGDISTNIHTDIASSSKLIAPSILNIYLTNRLVPIESGRLGTGALTTTDWHTIVENGWYKAATGTPNNPDSVSGISLQFTAEYYHNSASEHAVLRGRYLAVSTSTDTAEYMCIRTSGVWGPWFKIISSQAELDLRYAGLDSPTFTGTPAAPTAANGTSTTQVATTAFVQNSKMTEKTEWISAGAWVPNITNGPARGLHEHTTNFQMLEFLSFDPTTQERAGFLWNPPPTWDLGTIAFHAVWLNRGTNTGTVIWQLEAVAISNDETADASWGTAQSSTDTFLAQWDTHMSPKSSAITIAGTPTAGDVVWLRIKRDVANDTMNNDADLLGVVLYGTW